MKRIRLNMALAVLVASGGVFAQAPAVIADKGDHGARQAADGKSADNAYAEGEVRKVDKDAGKITLRHGPIANLDMPAMSMVFRAKDAAMLDQVKQGDKIRFKVEKIEGALTLTEIKPSK